MIDVENFFPGILKKIQEAKSKKTAFWDGHSIDDLTVEEKISLSLEALGEENGAAAEAVKALNMILKKIQKAFFGEEEIPDEETSHREKKEIVVFPLTDDDFHPPKPSLRNLAGKAKLVCFVLSLSGLKVYIQDDNNLMTEF